jgi:hypothetical protein
MAYCGANLGFSNVAAPNRARSHHHKHAASIARPNGRMNCSMP